MMKRDITTMILSVVVITVGVVLLLNNLGVTSIDVWDVVSTWWPVFLVIWGLDVVLTPTPKELDEHGYPLPGSNNRRFWGWISLWFGLMLLSRNAGYHGYYAMYRVWGLFWPVVVILIGWALFRSSTSSPKWGPGEGGGEGEPNHDWSQPGYDGPGSEQSQGADWDEADVIRDDQGKEQQTRNDGASQQDYANGNASSNYGYSGTNWAFMSGIEERRAGWKLRSGSYVAFMGGINLDLRVADIPDGITYLDLTAVMGGIEIEASPDVTVECEGTAVLGGVEVFRQGIGGVVASRYLVHQGAPGTRKVIRIKCRAVMGSVEVKE